MALKTTGTKLNPAGAKPSPEKSAQDAMGAPDNTVKLTPVVVRRKEMVARIAASSGVKPNLIKSVLDSVLKELGDALFAGESLNLEPLGKLSVNRQRETEKAKIVICKLRRSNVSKVPTDTSVEAAE